jgi:long-chain acyl-CoA synthetase
MSQKPWLSSYPPGKPSEVTVPDITLIDVLRRTTAAFPEREAMRFYDAGFSYRQLDMMSDRFAAGLAANGVNKDDRVGIMLPNSPHYVIAYYGVLKAGGVVVQVNPMYVEREIAYTIKDAEAKTMVVFEQFYPRVQAIRGQAGIERVIVVSFGPLQAALDDQSIHFDAFLQNADPVPQIAVTPEDLAVLQYTGGTTGRSKGVMLTHHNLVANIYQIEPNVRNEDPSVIERTLTVIPLFHVYGMTVCMNLTILLAGTMVLLPRFDLEEVLVTIRDKKPTMFPGVPTMYIAVNSHPKAEEYGISSIRICNSGSAPMPLEAMKSFEAKTGASLLEGYGLSETSPVTHSNPYGGVKKPGSVGIPLPNTDCKIVDVTTGTKELQPGEEGEIIIKGPQVMMG